MRSNERTYSQAIGAFDPDKKDSLHNKACQFLADPQFFPRIAEITCLKDIVFEKVTPHLSCPIWKRSHSYNGNIGSLSLFGFADLLISLTEETRIKYHDRDEFHVQNIEGYVLIEVKSNKVETLDCIQQIKAYRGLINYHSHCRNLLVTLYPITKQDKAILLNNRIHHVYLQPEKVSEYFSAHEIDNDGVF